MVILKYLLYLCVLSLPLGMLIRIQYSSGLAINFIDLVVLITSLYGFIYFGLKNKLNFKYKLEASLFFLIAILSLIVNIPNLATDKLLVSSFYLIRLLSYFLIFVIISKQSEKIKKNLISLVIFSSTTLSVIGFAQLLFYPYLRNLAYLGWDVHLYRLVSSFLDPNFAGVFFGISSILVFNLIFEKYSTKKSIDFLRLILLAISVGSLILTYSRGAILAFFVALVINLLLIDRKKYLFPLFIFVALVTSFMFMTNRSEGTNIFRSTSSLGRLESYQEGITLFKESPIFGVGFNTYRFASEKHSFPKDGFNFPDHGASGNDNSFLFLLVTTGIVGFTAFIYLVLSIFKELLINKKQIHNRIVICSLILVFLSSFFVNALFFPMIMLYIFLLLGVRGSR